MANSPMSSGSTHTTTLTVLALLTGFLMAGITGRAEGVDTSAPPRCHGETATIVGTAGDDQLTGTPSDDVIVGGGGQDSIYGGAGDDIICGGAGPTRYIDGDPVYQSLNGGPGNDVVVGGSGVDGLSGSDGADLLIGGGGGDFLSGDDGGPGGDEDVLRGGTGRDFLLGGKGADQLYGQEGEDRFEDRAGANSLNGGGGDDLFLSGPGDDALDGGSGVDTASYVNLLVRYGSSSHCEDITADLSAGTASGKGFGSDTLEDVETLATGGGDDVLVGDDGANTFFVGDPCYDNVAPREYVTGGGGSDRINFDSNTYGYGSAFGPVAIDLAEGTAEQLDQFSGAPRVLVTLDSIENATGTEYPDVIMGDDRPNQLSGGQYGYARGDLISGRGGNDNLLGSAGRDEINGDEGDDKLRGRDGNDDLDGGLDINTIDGGQGKDTCQNPNRHNGALNCEA